MQLVRFGDPAAYYAHVKEFLAANEAEHCLMLGICTTLIERPEQWRETPYLAAIQREDRVVAAAMRTPPHNVVLSLVAPDVRGPAVELLALDLYATYGTALPGAIAPSPVSADFAEHWHTVTERAYHLSMKERIYRLEQVAAPSGVPGRMRPAGEADRELLARWIEEFDAEALGGREIHDGAAWVESALDATPDLRGLWLWEDAQPVSLVGYSGRTPNGMRIGPVYTPREHRGHGYASALTAGVSRMLLDGGRRFVFLFTNLANPTANHIYQEIGYRPVGDVDVVEFAS
jgi:predicted GNAT family acetyltransferase